MGVKGLEPLRLHQSTDFKSAASTIPPHPHEFVLSATSYSIIFRRSVQLFAQGFSKTVTFISLKARILRP